MEAVREYGLINAKVRAWRSRLLTESAYHSLAAAKDEKDLVNILSQTGYKNAAGLAGLDPEALEFKLQVEETDRLLIIEKYSKSDSKKFVRMLLERYDAERLKAALRLWHARSSNPIQPPLGEGVLYNFSVQDIIDAPDLGEIAALLEGTPFHEAVTESIPLYEERKTLFPVELAIDRDLFDRLWKAGMDLNALDRKIVRGLLGVEIDLKNLDWISRFRNYYKLPLAEIKDLLLPNGSKLDSEFLNRMASENRLSEAMFRVTRGTGVPVPGEDPLSRKEGAQASNLDAMERFLHQILLDEAKRAFRANTISIGSILGYFYCMRIETRNLRMLFTGKRYGFSRGSGPAATQQQLERNLIL
jgi:vacuolar-type H+-ATPase subunit C/Vma6